MTSKRARENASLGNRIRAIQTGLAEVEAKNRTPAPDPEATTVENLRQQVAMLMSANWRIDQEQDYWDLRYYSSFPTISTVNRRGTTAERDAWYPLPTTDAERVALANQKIVWFNTDTMWEESYYAVTGLTGLTVLGLVAGTASGWYPTGVGPRGVLYGSSNQYFAGVAANYTNWSDFATGDSHRSHTFFTRSSERLLTSMPGRYRAACNMEYTTGNGTAAISLDVITAADVGIKGNASGVTLHPSFGWRFHQEIANVMIPAGGYARVRSLAGDWTVGGGGSFLTLEYLAPPLVSV